MEKMQGSVPNVRLREQRELKNKTQAEIAEIIGVSEITVGRWERGQAFPIPYYVSKLCRYFEKTPEELGLVPQTRLASVSPLASEQSEDPLLRVDAPAAAQAILPPTPINQPGVPTPVLIRNSRRFFTLPSSRYMYMLLSILLLGSVLFGVAIFRGVHLPLSGNSGSAPAIPITSTATLSTIGYPIAGWQLLLDDKMTSLTRLTWQIDSPGGCLFKVGEYHIVMQTQNYCIDTVTHDDPRFALSNRYTYEIQLEMLQGQQAGILFCKAHTSFYKPLTTPVPPYRYFGITPDGKYDLFYDAGNGDTLLASGISPYIYTGFNIFNTLAVTTYNNMIYMYINGHLIDSVKDTHSCDGGMLGVEAASFPVGMASMEPTEVIYKDMKVWEP